MLLLLVLVTGLEPVRYCYRGILSPLRLPISPHQRAIDIIIDLTNKVKNFFENIFIIKVRNALKNTHISHKKISSNQMVTAYFGARDGT